MGIAETAPGRLMIGRAQAWLVWAAAVLFAIATAFFRGRASQQSDQEAHDAKDYRDTRKRMDAAHGADLGQSDADWLRDRSKR